MTMLYAVFGIHSGLNEALKKPINTIVLIFDEFSLEQVGGYELLEDKTRFPNFNRLLANSDIYYNAISNDTNTETAVPSIIVGHQGNLLSSGFYGSPSLFDNFRNSHRSKTIELVNSFENQYKGNFISKTEQLLIHYISAVYTNPSTAAIIDLSTLSINRDYFSTKRSQFFNYEFIHNNTADNRPFFYFQHILLPHRPYQWNSGFFYNQNDIADKLFQDEFDNNSPSLINMTNLRARYIDQLKRADKELGTLLKGLIATHSFENTIIIITADHGISFTPGKSARTIQKGNQAPIQFIPLIVKNAFQTKRHEIYKPVSNLSVYQLALQANGATCFKETPKPVTGSKILNLINTTIKPLHTDLVSNKAEYQQRIIRQSAPFILTPVPSSINESKTLGNIVPEQISDYIVIEPGGGNTDLIQKNSDYYPYNLVFSIYGNKAYGNKIWIAINNKPCTAIEINKHLKKYSIYCSLPTPKCPSDIDFYLEYGNTYIYLPKKIGYNHFTSSRWSGHWFKINNATKRHKRSILKDIDIFLAANHREIIFINRKTGNITQRINYPMNFNFDRIFLYSDHFMLKSKDGKQIILSYITS